MEQQPSIFGNLWICNEGLLTVWRNTVFAGGRDTFLRYDWPADGKLKKVHDERLVTPYDPQAKNEDNLWMRYGRRSRSVATYLVHDKAPGKSTEVIGYVRITDEVRIQSGSFIVGRDSRFVTTGPATVSVASTLGACAAFWVGRTVARGWIEQKAAAKPRFQAIDRAVGREGFKIVLLTRLSPIFPFNFQNYAYGLTRVAFWKYALASWVGMLPGTLMYVYIGSGLQSLTEATSGEVSGGWVDRAFLFGGLAIAVVVAVGVARVARRALRETTESEDEGAGRDGHDLDSAAG